LAGAALMGVGVAFSTPAFFTAVFATAGPQQRGAASGTASACIDLGLGGGPILLGLFAEGLGIPWAFGAAAGVALAGAVWTMSWAGVTRRQTGPDRGGDRQEDHQPGADTDQQEQQPDHEQAAL